MQYPKESLEILEIFWNPKKHRARNVLTEELAAFLEVGDLFDQEFAIRKSLFSLTFTTLEIQGLVRSKRENNTTLWFLTHEGHHELNKKHPKLKNALESFIQSTPTLLLIISGIIGFFASLAGIIQFFDWLHH